ncbi:MAG TPA: Hint domain-containing protein [Stellaceae bacterium]|jgi:hypothetical protein|nr:Hint domain-containing protein [Stellaceae bacterium]
MSTVYGTVAHTITLTATGTYNSPLTISTSGYVGNGGTAVFGPNTQAWSVENYGTVDGTIDFLRGGNVSNASGGFISASADGVDIAGAAGTVINAGVISGSEGIDLFSGGSVTNEANGFVGGGIYAILVGASAATINNVGMLSGRLGGALLGGGGILTNSGGTIQGGGIGVRVDIGGTITNAAGLISGGNYGVYLGNGVGLLINDAGAVIDGLADGIKEVEVSSSGWTVSNSGAINGGRTAGVYFNSGGKLINNAGGVISGGSYGVEIQNAAGTVVDAGTIIGAGGAAIGFEGAGANRLVLDPGAVLSGSVIGSTATVNLHGSVTHATNTLELTAGGSAGTLTGFGTSFVNFGTVAVDSSADWVLSGNNTLASGVTLIDSGSLVNAGTLDFEGVLVPQGGTLNNTGTILNGVYASGGAAIVVNSGTIDDAAQAVDLINGGTVVNTAGGVISGGFLGGISIYAAAGIVTNSGTITTGDSGPGIGIYLQTGGRVSNAAGGLIVGADGIYSAQGGSVANAAGGVISGVGYGIGVAGGSGTVVNAGTIIATGTINGTDTGNGVGVMLKNGGTLIDTGTINSNDRAVAFGRSGVYEKPGNNLLVLENGYQLVGTAQGSTSPGVTNTVELRGAAGALNVNFNGLTLNNFGTVAFGAASGNSETLTLADTASLPGTISSFNQLRDIIDLTQIGPVEASATLGAGNHLVVSNGSQSVSLQLDGGDYSSVHWLTRPDGTGGTDVAVACYCRGTRVRTPHREMRVEELAIGDLLVTLSGEAKPIRWIGRRAYNGRFVAGNRAVLPICIKSDAITKGVPARDLWVSPEHSLFIDDVLVQAKHLINNVTVVRNTNIEEVEYFHIELESHDVIYADGAPAETFVDCENRLMFANGAEYARLYPDDERPRWQFCAPRLEWGSPALTAIRERMFHSASLLAGGKENQPHLHLVVDGVTILPFSLTERVARFELPPGSEAVWLCSQSLIPAESDPTSFDIRRLGVALQYLVLSDGDVSVEVRHSHPGFADGFHADENSHRWTDGRARIPRMLLSPFPGAVTLDVHLSTPLVNTQAAA